jgi:hypothetical protein
VGYEGSCCSFAALQEDQFLQHWKHFELDNTNAVGSVMCEGWYFDITWKHLHDRIISPRGEVLAHKTSLTAPFSALKFSKIIETDAKSIPLTHKYMSDQFPVLIQALQ